MRQWQIPGCRRLQSMATVDHSACKVCLQVARLNRGDCGWAVVAKHSAGSVACSRCFNSYLLLPITSTAAPSHHKYIARVLVSLYSQSRRYRAQTLVIMTNVSRSNNQHYVCLKPGLFTANEKNCVAGARDRLPSRGSRHVSLDLTNTSNSKP